MQLQQGATYEADVLLSGLQAAFAGPQDVANKLAGFGFTEVKVSGARGSFHVTATWGRQDTDIALPAQVQNVREVDPRADDVQGAAPAKPAPSATGKSNTLPYFVLALLRFL